METCVMCEKEYEDKRTKKPGKIRRYCSKKCSDRAQRISQKYNLTPKDYNQMLELQGGCCAICAEVLTSEPHVDHDNATHIVRGLLCASCNGGLGLFRDKPEWLEAAVTYLHTCAQGLLPQNKIKANMGKCVICKKRFIRKQARTQVCSQVCRSQLWRREHHDQYLQTRRDYYQREGK